MSTSPRFKAMASPHRRSVVQSSPKKVFVACKTTERTKKGAEEELHRSLKRMETGFFDLYQLHAVSDVDKDVKRALSPKGAIQAFLKAREEGLVRFLGFSAHSDEAALYAMRNFDFDTILYPSISPAIFRGISTSGSLPRRKKGRWASSPSRPWPNRDGAKAPTGRPIPSAGTSPCPIPFWRRRPSTGFCPRVSPPPCPPATRDCSSWPSYWAPGCGPSHPPKPRS